jgi:hypothetical protein
MGPPGLPRSVSGDGMGMNIGMQVSGKRHKLSYLPIPAHERLAPFTSMAIRIVCVSQEDIQQFRGLCSIAHLTKVDEYDYLVNHRDLFGLADMITMRDHLCRLPWIVAFQMESLLRKDTNCPTSPYLLTNDLHLLLRWPFA